MGSHGLDWIWSHLTGFYWVLLGFTGFYWVLLGLAKTYAYPTHGGHDLHPTVGSRNVQAAHVLETKEIEGRKAKKNIKKELSTVKLATPHSMALAIDERQ